MKILLLSGYDAPSHRRWRTQLVAHLPHHQWKVLHLPPRHFAWRFRGNPLSFVSQHPELWTEEYDLLLATSMVDLNALRGLVPNLARIPSICYFHENQLAYPVEQKEAQRDIFHHSMQHLYAALSADCVLFNSHYNRQTLLSEARSLMKRMPDCNPTGIVDRLESRCHVLPVPLEEHCFVTHVRREGCLRIVWNHRWEYDKAPERFFRALFRLQEEEIPFEVCVFGQQFRKVPDIFEEAQHRLQGHIVAWGFQESRQEYVEFLQNSDVVVSTALHEFQGLAVLEAVAAGCYPLLPDRLAYSELFEDRWLYKSTPDDEDKEVERLARRLKKMSLGVERLRGIPVPEVRRLSWEKLTQDYENWMQRVAG